MWLKRDLESQKCSGAPLQTLWRTQQSSTHTKASNNGDSRASWFLANTVVESRAEESMVRNQMWIAWNAHSPKYDITTHRPKFDRIIHYKIDPLPPTKIVAKFCIINSKVKHFIFPKVIFQVVLVELASFSKQAHEPRFVWRKHAYQHRIRKSVNKPVVTATIEHNNHVNQQRVHGSKCKV